MGSNKALTEHHNGVSVDMEFVSKFENSFLENIDDILCELICVSLSPLDGGFDFSEDYFGRLCQISDVCLELSHEAVEL